MARASYRSRETGNGKRETKPRGVLRLGKRERLLRRGNGLLRGLRPLPERHEVLAEHSAHDVFRVAAPEELLRDDGQLRDVLEAVRRVVDPVVVGAEAGGPGTGDLHHALDVVHDRRPFRAGTLEVVEQGR